MKKNRFHFSRRLFLVQGASLLAGCRSLTELPPLPFLEKEEGNSTSLLNVEGEVTEIKTTNDWRFMAVRARTRPVGSETEENGGFQPGNTLSLYNIEFQRPLPCTDYALEAYENPLGIAFTPKTKECFIVSGASAWNAALDKGIAVDRIVLSSPGKKKGPAKPFHLQDPSWIDALISPGGDWIAVQNREGTWSFRDLTEDPVKEVCFPESYKSKTEERETHVSRVLAISPDGMLAATLMAPSPETGGGQDQTIAVWDLSTAHSIPVEKAKKLPLEALFVSEFHIRDNAAGRICAFSHDGQMFAVRNKQKYVGIWQTASGKILSEFGEHRQPITALQFTPNNTKLVIGTGENSGRLILWDVRKGRLLRTYNDPEKRSRKITAIQVSPDGNLVYFGNDRGNVNQWEYQSESEVKKA